MTESEKKLRQEIVRLKRELAECSYCRRKRKRLTEIIAVLPTLEPVSVQKARAIMSVID